MTRAERNVILAANAATIREQKAEIERAEVAACRMQTAIRWALGEGDDFPAREDGQGAYWWRNELRERAALASSAPCSHVAELAAMRKECDGLAAWVDIQPHANQCSSRTSHLVNGSDEFVPNPCDCWKARMTLPPLLAARASTGTCPYEKELAEAKALLAECEGWLKEDSPGELIDKIEAFEKGGGE